MYPLNHRGGQCARREVSTPFQNGKIVPFRPAPIRRQPLSLVFTSIRFLAKSTCTSSHLFIISAFLRIPHFSLPAENLPYKSFQATTFQTLLFSIVFFIITVLRSSLKRKCSSNFYIDTVARTRRTKRFSWQAPYRYATQGIYARVKGVSSLK